ncbi:MULTISPECIES: hypothetical protein [unclassified Pseudonocardia]|uniref:hypothetical protein n=1 Tax=unclassified Pseudonocardia TaxID=2619320 RepID=UPI001CF67CCC|nr:hypothetical protein [Pseudonocardia sp. ICBG601]
MGTRKTNQVVDGWSITAMYDDQVSSRGPARLVIEPAEGADWYATAGGISSTVLRQVVFTPPTEPSDQQERAHVLLKYAAAAFGPSTPEYLSVLAMAYSCTTNVHNPSGVLAELTGRSPGTVKAHLVAARKAGLLTTIPHRAGGGLTHEGAIILSRVIKTANAQSSSTTAFPEVSHGARS